MGCNLRDIVTQKVFHQMMMDFPQFENLAMDAQGEITAKITEAVVSELHAKLPGMIGQHSEEATSEYIDLEDS